MVKLSLYNPDLTQSITTLGCKIMAEKLIDIAAELRHETDKAYLIYDGRSHIKKGDTQPSDLLIWIPKSQCEYNEDDGSFAMPEWLALEKGFI